MDTLGVDPVGVTVAPGGSLLITEDGSNSIWRVSYTGTTIGQKSTRGFLPTRRRRLKWPGPGSACCGYPGNLTNQELARDNRSEQPSDARSQRHGRGAPERNTYRAYSHSCAAGVCSQPSQKREEGQ
jgi:hypothetical protein